ncbi:hypothetical protein COCON_G00194530 [Conger conger]|uniref:Uncharacterized protein n=1 Tax=Conger conger TaxID=82655 RepID=A0A9Q1HQN1_CONCO|nr:hypothetical protein COCON_G00194530 [Conger conger]
MPWDCRSDRESVLEPYQLVEAAWEEYLQRKQEANQYKLRAEKQLGLRPSTADAERYRAPERGREEGGRHGEAGGGAPHLRQGAQQEYLRQLQLIRQQYQHDLQGMKMKAAAEPQPQDKAQTFVVDVPPEPKVSAARRRSEDSERSTPAQKGVMFEVLLNDERTRDEGEKGEEDEGEEVKETVGQQEEGDDLLNQTLTFQAGEELRQRGRAGAGAGAGAGGRVGRGPGRAGVRVHPKHCSTLSPKWRCPLSAPPCWSSMLALGQRDLITTLDPEPIEAPTPQPAENQPREVEDEEDDLDIDLDEERLEPRSDEDDTNFEESEDELREETESRIQATEPEAGETQAGEPQAVEEDQAEAGKYPGERQDTE